MREDIVRQLGLRDPLVLVGNFDRPNLIYRVRPRLSREQQLDAVMAAHRGEAGIIYCISRKDVDQTAAALADAGHKAVPYHAGLSDDERRRNQDAFIDERADVVVATVAFGMGIDRSNVRFVIHAGVPKSLEHYQQEAGRAGRDGLDAECLLLYSSADFLKWKRIMELSGELSDADVAHLRQMERYASAFQCRHKTLVEHFGQPYEGTDCGACDVCLGEIEKVDDPLILAQKIGSCVARVKQRFGLVHVAAVLEGKSTPQVAQNGHDALSTFGLLKDLSANEIKGYIEQLVARGFLQRTPGDYPVLELTATGVAMLKGQVAAEDIVLCRQPKASTRSKSRAGRGDAAMGRVERESWEGVDRDLFDALRALRLEIARGRGVPPYVVFHDSTLREMARLKPGSLRRCCTCPASAPARPRTSASSSSTPSPATDDGSVAPGIVVSVRIVRLGSPRSARRRHADRHGAPAASRRAEGRVRVAGLVRRVVPDAGAEPRDDEAGAGRGDAGPVERVLAQVPGRDGGRPRRATRSRCSLSLSHHTDFSVGCYCEDETRCHRSLLRRLLIEHGADVAPLMR